MTCFTDVSLSWSGRLTQRPGETDVVLRKAVEHDLHPARLHHPFQPVVAVLAADRARDQAAGGVAHALGGGLELAEGRRDRGTLADAGAPGRQRRIGRRAETVMEGTIDVGRDAEIGPAEAVA